MKIILAKPVLALSSKRGYHTYNCPVYERRNKQHEKAAMGRNETTGLWAFCCCGCHREIHVKPVSEGRIILA